MSNPKISVIIPVYNAAQYLGKCLDSVLDQTFTDFELLLIDDGSKDSSGEICDRYAESDSRIRVFHKPNGGVSSARNLGLDNAKGEWIAFCDSDDYVEKDWLLFFLNASKSVDIVLQSVNCITSGVRKLVGFKNVQRFRDPMECVESILQISKGLLGYSVNKLFKGEIIKLYTLRYDVRLKFREDEEFVLKYFKHVTRAICIPYAGYNYIMPLNEKYLKTDVFWGCLQSYSSIKQMSIKQNSILRRYQNELINELISSMYATDCIDKKNRFFSFIKEVGFDIFRLESFTVIAKKFSLFLRKKLDLN